MFSCANLYFKLLVYTEFLRIRTLYSAGCVYKDICFWTVWFWHIPTPIIGYKFIVTFFVNYLLTLHLQLQQLAAAIYFYLQLFKKEIVVIIHILCRMCLPIWHIWKTIRHLAQFQNTTSWSKILCFLKEDLSSHLFPFQTMGTLSFSPC